MVWTRYLVLDEAQQVKNNQSSRCKSLLELTLTLTLTQTPYPDP